MRLLLFLLALPLSTHAAVRVTLSGAAENVGPILRLTPAQKQLSGAAWLEEKQTLANGFSVNFTFQLTEQGGLGDGADGLAFVIQNEGAEALAGRGSAGGFAAGDGWRNPRSQGIPNSVAVFFDTHRNYDAYDPSGNYVAICTNGSFREMSWPPSRLAVNAKIKTNLKDGKPHKVRIDYLRPLLAVHLDGVMVLRAPVDLRTVLDEQGDGFMGFTAATGDGYQNHDILDWAYTIAPRPAVTSDISSVISEIQFARGDCHPKKNLCTPREASVDRVPGSPAYAVTLPAHLDWTAAVPLPRIDVANARGMVCFELPRAMTECAGPHGLGDQPAGKGFPAPDKPAGALLVDIRGGARALFMLNLPDKSRKAAQGYLEFEVRPAVNVP